MQTLPPPLIAGEGWPYEDAPLSVAAGEWPRISVITVCLNSEAYLEQTIRSVLLQGYPNLEYMIIDGGSTDGTLEIIKHYEAHLAGWISEADRGQSQALNKGFARSTGAIMAWLNSDDYYLPDTLAFAAREFMTHQGLDWLAGSVRQVDERGATLRTVSTESLHAYSGKRLFKNGADFRHPVDQPAVFWSRRWWDAVGPLDETYHYCMDHDLWLRAFARGFVPRWVGDELTAFRVHGASKTSARRVEMLRELARLFGEKAWQAGFRWAGCMGMARYFLREMWLAAADQSIERGQAVRAAAAVSLAMIATPSVIRRRLYTWRQIARLIRVASWMRVA
jgi:glycosyltransferase involved in cell wall biosynthesis